MSIKKSKKRAKKVLKSVEKALKKFDNNSKVLSYGTKLNDTEGCSNHLWVRVDLGAS